MTEAKEILTLAVEIGSLLLKNGGEIYRVEDTILHILDAFDIKDSHVYVLSNGIFASANEQQDEPCCIIRNIPLGTVHLEKIVAANQLSRELCKHHCTIPEAWERLAYYKTLPAPPRRMQQLCCGIGCACFTYIFGGDWLDAFCTFLLCYLLQYFRLLQQSKEQSHFLSNIYNSAYLTGSSLLLFHIGLPIQPDKIVIGAIVPLLPGLAFTTSIRNLFGGNYLSGAIYLLNAFLTAVCIAAGVGIVMTLYRSIPGGVSIL